VSGPFDDRSLLRPFRLGVLAVAIAFVLLGGLVAAFGTGANRPEGVAERWLADVGDTRRDGLRDRARRDAEEVGPLELAEELLPAGDTQGRSAFVDLEVGKATRVGDRAEVPFRLHQREDGGAGPAIDGTVVLEQDADDEWRVVAVDPAVDGVAVPSEGGDPLAEAPPELFVAAFAVAVAVAAVCSVAVRAADPVAQPGGTRERSLATRSSPPPR
jgi:hypothetical protein